jgi:hypothetical protein
VSGEAHPKELDETWDSQIFRYSKMFPLKTKFFCYQALLFTHPCVPAPWFVASSRVYTFLVCTFLQMYPDVPRADRAFLPLGSLPNQGALSFRYGAFLFACLSFPISIVSRGRSSPHLPIAPHVAAGLHICQSLLVVSLFVALLPKPVGLHHSPNCRVLPYSCHDAADLHRTEDVVFSP